MNREKIKNKLDNKKIIIKGMGIIAHEFVHRYSKRLDLSFCTSLSKHEILDQLVRIELDDILDNKDDFFIIVCTDNYEAASFELISKGLLPGVHFASYKVLEALLENMEIFLAVGQCELEVTNYIFQHLNSLKTEIQFFYFDEYKVLGIAEKKPQINTLFEINFMCGLADYFIYPVNLSVRGEFYTKLLQNISDNCYVVSVPLSTFEGYWPQDNRKDYYEKSKYYLSAFSASIRRDINIENALENGEEDILIQLSQNDYYDEQFVEKNIDRTIKKFMILEKKSDVIISDFFQHNVKKVKLYLDRGHASTLVLKEYAKRILERCNIEFTMEEVDNVDLQWYDNCHSEFPIYPCVQKQLSFGENEKYRVVFNNSISYLSFKEYMKLIYELVKRGMEYINEEKNCVYSK